MRAALIAILVSLAAVAHASPSEDLDLAREAYGKKDYTQVMKSLTYLLYPKEQLAIPGELVEAHLLLGVAYFETGRPGEAKEEFKQVLRLEPGKTLDAALFSTGAIRLFDETKAELDDQRRKLEEQRRIEQLQKAQEDYLKSLRPIEVHPYWENFVPLGGAQFLQHRGRWGTFFFSTQFATLGTSVGIWLYLAGKYGIVSSNVPREDVTTVRDLQTLEIGSGVAFIVLYGWSLYDSIHHYQPQLQIKGDDSLLPPELRKKPKPLSLRDRIHVVPLVTPNGAGLGIGWEN